MSKKATEAVCMISTEKGKMLTVSARTRKYYDLNAARYLKEKGLYFYLIASSYFKMHFDFKWCIKRGLYVSWMCNAYLGEKLHAVASPSIVIR